MKIKMKKITAGRGVLRDGSTLTFVLDDVVPVAGRTEVAGKRRERADVEKRGSFVQD